MTALLDTDVRPRAAAETAVPLVGAVIPARNRFPKTARFLEGLTQQTYRGLRIYVVDSHSSDQTSDYIDGSFDNVVLLQAGDDDFWSGATNVGVEQALKDGCDYILTINDDSVIGPEFVEQVVEIAQRRDLMILASRVDHLQDMGQVWSTGAYNNWGSHQLFYLRNYLAWEDDVPELQTGPEIIEVEQTPGNGVLIHRSVFETIGLYDAKWCPHQHGDSEFILRARKHGYRCFVSLRTLVYNDVDNWTGQIDILNPPDFFGRLPKPVRRLVSPVEKLYRLFWHKRSDRRIPTIAYIVMNYAPPGVRLKTLVLYYISCLWMFYGQRVLPARLSRGVARLSKMRRFRIPSIHNWVYLASAARFMWARQRSRLENRRVSRLFQTTRL